jgi:hypothetical protein
MINSMQGSPVLHGFGNEFAIVADKDFKTVPGLVFDSAMPQLENGSCFLFVSQGKTPCIQQKVINNIHTIQAP